MEPVKVECYEADPEYPVRVEFNGEEQESVATLEEAIEFALDVARPGDRLVIDVLGEEIENVIRIDEADQGEVIDFALATCGLALAGV